MELGCKVHHRVAFGTNYTWEERNSKISENNRTDNSSLVQLIEQIKPYGRASSSIPTSDNYFENNCRLKIEHFGKKKLSFGEL